MKQPNEIMISQRLTQLRKERYLSLGDICNIFDPPVSKGTVSNWENGRQYPNRTRVIILCDFYAVSIDYLYGRTEERKLNVIGESQNL